MTDFANVSRPTNNRELANAYWKCVMPSGVSLKPYLEKKKLIANSPVDFFMYFSEHGTLQDCGVRGVGPITLNVLESILDLGVDDAQTANTESYARKLREGARPTGSSKRRRSGGHGFSGGDGFVDL